MRPELEPLPKAMENLPVDKRGYPVPFFVYWHNGEPEFRGMDTAKWIRAIREKLCWVCGGKLTGTYVFVAGPMCGINKINSEPPSHPDCARWSARNCPFLTKPEMVRRQDDIIDNQKVRENTAGQAIMRNPGVAMCWFTREFEVFEAGNGKLIMMGRPAGIEWYREGRKATRAEVLESIEEGFPAIEATCNGDPRGLEQVRKRREIFEERWLPK